MDPMNSMNRPGPPDTPDAGHWTPDDLIMGPHGVVTLQAPDVAARRAMQPTRSLMAAMMRHSPPRVPHPVLLDDDGQPLQRRIRPPRVLSARRDLRRARNLRRAAEHARSAHDDAHGDGGPAPTFGDASDEDEALPTGERLPSLTRPMHESVGVSPDQADPVERLIPRDLDQPLPWHHLVARFAAEANEGTEVSYARPHRRRLAQGMVVPRPRGERVPQLVVAIDTSGSISDRKLAIFRREVSVLRELADDVTVIFCDFDVRNVLRGDELSWWLTTADAPAPGGGKATDHIPVFRYIAARGLEPSLLVGFTDLDTYLPETAPSYPVLWVCPGEARRDPAFGTVVTIPLPNTPEKDANRP